MAERKLTDEEVLEIRDLSTQGWEVKTLAAEYMVTENYAWMIVNGYARTGQRRGRELGPKDGRRIKALVAGGQSQAQVARDEGISPSMVSNIMRGRSLKKSRKRLSAKAKRITPLDSLPQLLAL